MNEKLIEEARSFLGGGGEATLIGRMLVELEEAERIRRLHEVATEQNVKLAAVIEKAREVAGGYAFTGLRYALTNTHDGPLAVDSSAVLAEHDAKVLEDAAEDWHALVMRGKPPIVGASWLVRRAAAIRGQVNPTREENNRG